MSPTKQAEDTGHRGRPSSKDRRQRRATAAADPRTSTRELTELAAQHPWTKVLMVTNPSAPAQVLTELAATGAADVRRAVVYNPASPAALLEMLRVDPAVAAAAGRQLVARTRPGFDVVSRWPDSRRIEAAHDPRTSPEHLDVLAHYQRTVREHVAANAAASPPTLHLLSRDPKKSVRIAVAAHPATPVESLASLSRDGEKFVRLAVAQRKELVPHLLARLAADGQTAIRARVAGHRSLPPDLMAMLADDADALVRRRIAAQRKLPATLFTRLHADPSADVRGVIAKNDACPPVVLAMLSDDPDPKVREHARRRLRHLRVTSPHRAEHPAPRRRDP